MVVGVSFSQSIAWALTSLVLRSRGSIPFWASYRAKARRPLLVVVVGLLFIVVGASGGQRGRHGLCYPHVGSNDDMPVAQLCD